LGRPSSYFLSTAWEYSYVHAAELIGVVGADP